MRIAALDLIRFFAALAVVLYHYISRPESTAFPTLATITQFGYLGVPLFFIISGYVIALSAENRTPIQFGISRFVRLYPALWAGVIFTVLTLTILTKDNFSIAQILANFTLLNEYMGFEDIDGVYWTLKKELKFYLCIFLLLLFGVFHQYKIWLSLWLGITVLHSLTGQPFFMGWFISPGYSSFFIAGIACFLIQKEGNTPFNLIVLLSSLVISSFKAFDQADGFLLVANATTKSIAVIIIWLSYALIYAMATDRIKIKQRKIILTLGALTYPLYLIHNLAGKAIIDQYSSFIAEEILIFTTIVIMLFISWVINITIEKPLATPLKNLLLSKFK
ncbi:acyltransferase [Oceanicoccus sp. KOV_DT_Chl]|uniref:acyltransferase family protein n=1 Tax=Oceanicoccus sp. KOV_DT_Chl TaxID=1904639 RepID=UPI000C796818|nr:acyltransferase [Oceanicoccus sp. KOV_DT_Chl]